MTFRDLRCKAMKEQELCKKRLVDLSNQADRRGIVTFSDFLNLNEQNIYHISEREFCTQARLYGGYDGAERQMVAFIPDALCYEWEFPICCIMAEPKYKKYAEKLTHRDILGALMHLGIDRGRIGDIVCKDQSYYIFCEETIQPFILEILSKIRNTVMSLSILENTGSIEVQPEFEERLDMIASNRIDCIIAKAYHFSRSEAAEYLGSEKVFINGKCITNCNQSCENGAIISVRGKGRFIFETDQTFSKKGKLRVTFKIYK